MCVRSWVQSEHTHTHTHTRQGLKWLRVHYHIPEDAGGILINRSWGTGKPFGCSKRLSITNSRVRTSPGAVSRKEMEACKPKALCRARGKFKSSTVHSLTHHIHRVQHHIHREAISYRTSKNKSVETALSAQEALNGTQHQRQTVQDISWVYKVGLCLGTLKKKGGGRKPIWFVSKFSLRKTNFERQALCCRGSHGNGLWSDSL